MSIITFHHFTCHADFLLHHLLILWRRVEVKATRRLARDALGSCKLPKLVWGVNSGVDSRPGPWAYRVLLHPNLLRHQSAAFARGARDCPITNPLRSARVRHRTQTGKVSYSRTLSKSNDRLHTAHRQPREATFSIQVVASKPSGA